MSALDTLLALGRGDRPASGLLHRCRFEGFGSEGYGEEAIVERFRKAQFALPDDTVVLECPGHLAIFANDRALFADIAEGGIVRLWVLSGDQAATSEPGVSVVFDPDLAQARGDLFMAASDHRELDAAGAARVAGIGRALVRDDPEFRTRGFAIRAFGSGDRGAALFAIYRLGGLAERTSGFACAAVCWRESEALIVHDRAGEAVAANAPWTPRIGP